MFGIAIIATASGGTVFRTGVGAQSAHLPVSATAEFTLANGTLELILTNLESGPSTVDQALSGIGFELLNAHSDPHSIFLGISGTSASVGSDGTTFGAMYITDSTALWKVSISNGGTSFAATALYQQPDYTILGLPGSDDHYHVNSSITNKAHNPFFEQTATHKFTLGEIGSDVRIGNVFFTFGTKPVSLPATSAGGSLFRPVYPATPAGVPEPSTARLAISGIAVLALAAFWTKRLRKA